MESTKLESLYDVMDALNYCIETLQHLLRNVNYETSFQMYTGVLTLIKNELDRNVDCLLNLLEKKEE